MISALILGLVGSLHCLGMCSGFALAFGRQGRLATFAYQAGRLLGYCLGGAVVGSFGLTFSWLLGSRYTLVAAALVMIGLGLGWDFEGRPMQAVKGSFGGRALLMVGRFMRQPGPRSAALMGLCTALLPCGLLSAAWLRAAAAATPLAGSVAMACFWLGTLPATLSVARLSPWLRSLSPGWWPLLASRLVMLVGVAMLVEAALPVTSCCGACGMP